MTECKAYLPQHIKYMLECAYKRVGDTKQAEEIVQNAFVSLINNVEKIIDQDSNKIKHYIVITTINKCNDFFRKKQSSAMEGYCSAGKFAKKSKM